AEERRAARAQPVALVVVFLGELIGDAVGGPDLAVRMGIAGAGLLAVVLEDRDGADVAACVELRELLSPGADGVADLSRAHRRHAAGVIGGITEHAAGAALGLAHEEWIAFERWQRA